MGLQGFWTHTFNNVNIYIRFHWAEGLTRPKETLVLFQSNVDHIRTHNDYTKSCHVRGHV